MNLILQWLTVLGPIIGGILIMWWTQRMSNQRAQIERLVAENEAADRRYDDLVQRHEARTAHLEDQVAELRSDCVAMQAEVNAMRNLQTLWRVVYDQQNIEIERLGGRPVPLPPVLADYLAKENNRG